VEKGCDLKKTGGEPQKGRKRRAKIGQEEGSIQSRKGRKGLKGAPSKKGLEIGGVRRAACVG